MNMNERQRPPVPRWVHGLLMGIIICLYLPDLMMFWRAFTDVQPNGENQWTLKWFYEVFSDPELLDATGRSLFIATMSAVVATALGSLAAIALVKSQFPGQKILQNLAFISLVLPEIVFALALLGWFITMQFSLGSTTVIISHTTFCLAYVITTVMGRLSFFDPAIDDAARDLGASEWQILYKITLPMLKPALASSFALSFLLSFDDFLITFFVNSVGNDTLPVKLYAAIKYGVTPKINALSSMLFVVSSAILLIFFKSSLLGGRSEKERGFQLGDVRLGK